MRLIALVCLAALVVVGCGEKEDVLEPSGSKRVKLIQE
jgi:hypothetical protein